MNRPIQQAARFWSLQHPAQALAVVDAHSGLQKTYGELRRDVERAALAMPRRTHKALCLLIAQNRYESIVSYLAALTRGDALVVADASVSRELYAGLVATYHPEFIFTSSPDLAIPQYRKIDSPGDPGAGIWEREGDARHSGIHPSLAILLSTSGSTGSAKLVRLTLANLQANAESIVAYLGLGPEEKPITSLPMAYSYGLSVINSHLLAGATLTLTEHGVLRREFWDSVDRHACTSFSGVPYSYQMLVETGLLSKRGRTLRTFTQAGGRLAESHMRQVHRVALERGARFFVMYGQTEATARISYVPSEHLGDKIGSVGIAIPNGALQLDAGGELIYTGPNVMMGYAECRADLAKGDELQGVLRTGDLARQDEDGYFYLTGRKGRFLKMFGKRFNLEEIELLLQRSGPAGLACFGHDDLLLVAIEGDQGSAASKTLRETFRLPTEAFRIVAVPQLPRTANGKIDYPLLAVTYAHRAREEGR
jgi:long-chain acyl-CoA synthetase